MGTAPIDIEIRIRRVEQVFDSLDPAPFRDKALDRELETYLLDCMAEHPLGVARRLVVHAPAAVATHASDVESGIHSHFRFLLEQAERRARLWQRRFRAAMLMGAAVLTLALSLRYLVTGLHTAVGQVLSEGLLVLGWVALWRPFEVLLFERHAKREQLQQLRELSRIEVAWHSTEDSA